MHAIIPQSIEAVQHQPVSKTDYAKQLIRIMQLKGWTIDEVATVAHKSRRQIQRYIEHAHKIGIGLDIRAHKTTKSLDLLSV